MDDASDAPRSGAIQINRSDAPEVVWPPIAAGRAAVLGALLRQLDDTQWMAPDEIETQQRRQLALLAAHCVKYSPFFRRAMRAARLTPEGLAEPGALQRLAPLTRRDLQQASDLNCSMAPNAHMPVGESATSGSTGAPVKVRRTAINSMVQCGHILRGYRWHGRRFSDRMLAIRATFERIERRDDWGPPASLLFDTGPALNLPTNIDLDEQIARIEEFAPQVVSISPSNLAALARRCLELGRRLPSVELWQTMSETLSEETRRAAAEAFSARVVDTYSSQELGTVAIQCPVSGLYHVMAEGLVVEVLDEAGAPCAEGRAGRVVATDLLNFATPLVRYDIGDWAEPGPPCPCGRGLPTLARILGRERNLVRLPDGRRYWPRLGYARFQEIAPIIQFQVVQTTLQTLELKLVTPRPLTETEERSMAEHLRDSVGWPFEVAFTYVEGEIARGPGGKFEDFISRVG